MPAVHSHANAPNLTPEARLFSKLCPHDSNHLALAKPDEIGRFPATNLKSVSARLSRGLSSWKPDLAFYLMMVLSFTRFSASSSALRKGRSFSSLSFRYRMQVVK